VTGRTGSKARGSEAGSADRDSGVLVVGTSDGVDLGVRVLPATGAPRGTALCLHAMMVDHRAFRPAGDGLPGVLAAAGFDVWLPDLRGRGLSPHPGGHTYDDLVERDIPAVVEAARERGPVAVIGHSLGGHAAIAAAIDGFVADRYVLLATNTWLPSMEPRRRRRIAKDLAMRGFLAASRGGAFPSRRLRMGPVDEPRAYVEDLCRFWFEDRWASRSGRDWGDAMDRVTAPVLSVIGAGDRLMAHADGATIWAAGLPNATIEVVGTRTGLGFDPGHMDLVTDRRSKPIWERIARFLVG
jgi:predicted alpha/beta hydrolase